MNRPAIQGDQKLHLRVRPTQLTHCKVWMHSMYKNAQGALDALDTHSDGTVRRSELLAMTKVLHLHAFRRFDVECDGFIPMELDATMRLVPAA